MNQRLLWGLALAVTLSAGSPGLAAAQQPAAATLAAAQRPAAVTLADALQRAEQVQTGVVQARATVQNAQAAQRAASGAWLPSLSASSSAANFYSGQSSIDRNTGLIIPGGTTTETVALGLSASWDVFTGFRRGADIRAARAQGAAAESGLTDARYQQRLVTTNAFFDALAAAQLVRVREASVQRAEEQLKVSSSKLHAGTATRADSLQALVSLGTARSDLLTAGSQLTAAEAELARQVGADGRVAAVDDSSYYHTVATVDATALAHEATDSAPQVRSRTAQVDASQAAVKSARSGYWPTISLNGFAGYNGTSRNSYSLISQRQLALQLSWPIFNGFQREQAIVQQESQLDVAQAQAADTRRNVQSVVLAQAAALDAARERIGIAETSVDAATEALRVQRSRYQAGVATIVDVLTAQETLSQAEVSVVTARFDYLRAKAQIETALGRPL